MKQNKVSIITVTYNAEKYIENTIQSILDQSYKDFEYIIIDGKSSDKTIEIVDKYVNKHPILFISEKDRGVYDAMNKGVSLATGDWIIFMNAGDYFYSNQVLHNIFKNNINENISVVYGNAEFRLKAIAYIDKPNQKVTTSQFMPFSHQASFVRRDVLSSIPFNLDFKIAADTAFFLQLVKEGYLFQYVDETICSYNALEGLSADNDLKRSIEIVRLQELFNNINPLDEYFVNYIKEAERKALKRKILPKFLWNWLREIRVKKKHSVYRK